MSAINKNGHLAGCKCDECKPALTERERWLLQTAYHEGKDSEWLYYEDWEAHFIEHELPKAPE